MSVIDTDTGQTRSLAHKLKCSEAAKIRGLPFMTSAPRGGEGVQKSADFADKQSYRSADKGGRGSKNPKIMRT